MAPRKSMPESPMPEPSSISDSGESMSPMAMAMGNRYDAFIYPTLSANRRAFK